MTPRGRTGDGRLRLGVAGCGRVFERFHLPALERSRHWTLVGAADPLADRREAACRRVPGLLVYHFLDELIENHPLDAILICTPPPTHCDLSVKALQAGLHVLVEKPMAVSLAEGLLMERTAGRARRRLQVGFSRRFRRPYQTLRERIGGLPRGEVEGVHLELFFPSEKWHSVTHGLGIEAEGGGVLDDVASHQLDLLPWLLGEALTHVRVRHWNGEEGSGRIEFDLRFKSGLEASCLAGHAGAYSEVIGLRLQGRRLVASATGVLVAPRLPASWLSGLCRTWAEADFLLRRLTRRPGITLQSFMTQLDCFAAAVRGDEDGAWGADAASGIRCLQAIQACRESVEAGGSWRPAGAQEWIAR